MHFRYASGFFLFFLVALAVTLSGDMTVSGQADSAKIVVARVNGIPIMKSRLDALVSGYKVKARKKEVTDETKRELLRNLIRRELILSQKAAKTLRDDTEIREKVKEFEDNLIVSRFLEKHVGSKVTVTEEELREYYGKNIQEFSIPPKVKARHILLRSREEAEEVMSKLKNGADFVEMAKKYSIDLPRALEGGSMGTIEKGKALPVLDDTLFILGEGEISDIVKTRFGYHILTVNEMIPVQFKPFEKVREEVKRRILRKKEAKAFEEMAAKLEKNAHIQFF